MASLTATSDADGVLSDIVTKGHNSDGDSTGDDRTDCDQDSGVSNANKHPVDDSLSAHDGLSQSKSGLEAKNNSVISPTVPAKQKSGDERKHDQENGGHFFPTLMPKSFSFDAGKKKQIAHAVENQAAVAEKDAEIQALTDTLKTLQSQFDAVSEELKEQKRAAEEIKKDLKRSMMRSALLASIVGAVISASPCDPTAIMQFDLEGKRADLDI